MHLDLFEQQSTMILTACSALDRRTLPLPRDEYATERMPSVTLSPPRPEQPQPRRQFITITSLFTLKA